jgi:hypothetical protein
MFRSDLEIITHDFKFVIYIDILGMNKYCDPNCPHLDVNTKAFDYSDRIINQHQNTWLIQIDIWKKIGTSGTEIVAMTHGLLGQTIRNKIYENKDKEEERYPSVFLFGSFTDSVLLKELWKTTTSKETIFLEKVSSTTNLSFKCNPFDARDLFKILYKIKARCINR